MAGGAPQCTVGGGRPEGTEGRGAPRAWGGAPRAWWEGAPQCMVGERGAPRASFLNWGFVTDWEQDSHLLSFPLETEFVREHTHVHACVCMRVHVCAVCHELATQGDAL